jgi:EAL domain-containing protein (putative c-di-GMP-specific phosphodiesterase class I)
VREEQQRRKHLGETIAAALRQGRLLFAFQPIVCVKTGEVDYFECLLRLRDEDGAIRGGSEFVAALEALGTIGMIDHHVLDMALGELALHPRVKLGFNISGLTAGDRLWLQHLVSVLRRSPELASRLVVEITETAALSDLAESARFVDTVRAAGCRVALDDFGAGHTTLRHLEHLAIDTVKLDGSLVRFVRTSPAHRGVLRHLVGLAESIGFRLIAEGVENGEEAALLCAEGVFYLQGYHFGRPTTERVWLATTGSEAALAQIHPRLGADRHPRAGGEGDGSCRDAASPPKPGAGPAQAGEPASGLPAAALGRNLL